MKYPAHLNIGDNITLKLVDKEGYFGSHDLNKEYHNLHFDGDFITLKVADGFTGDLVVNEITIAIILPREWKYFEEYDFSKEKPNLDGVKELDKDLIIRELVDLIEESEGVAGLHANGDIATWDSLIDSGWLSGLNNLST